MNSQLGQAGRFRNLLHLNAHLGGFATALIKDPLWFMNVVHVEANVNTPGVVFERGLIGTYQNWSEAMSTYPRTFDLLHAVIQYSPSTRIYVLEMDRILRLEGSIIVRDDVDILVKVKTIADGMDWESKLTMETGLWKGKNFSLQ